MRGIGTGLCWVSKQMSCEMKHYLLLDSVEADNEQVII